MNNDYWDEIVNTINERFKKFDCYIYRYDNNYGKAFIINDICNSKLKHLDFDAILSVDSDIIFMEQEQYFFERLYFAAQEVYLQKQKDWGIIALNQREANCHLKSCYENKIEYDININGLPIHEKIFYPNKPSGIAGGCLFLNRTMWDTVGGYKVMGVYAGDDAYILVDSNKAGFSYQLMDTLSVIHPHEEDSAYAQWKYKVCQRDTKGIAAKDISVQIEEANNFWSGRTTAPSGDYLIWYNDGRNNWGDYVAPVLYKLISGKESVYKVYNDMTAGKRYITVGSLMEHVVNPNTIVWGTGFMWGNSNIPQKPKDVYAVRGKLSAKRLIEQGIKCPEIYGDPSMLFPRYYNPQKTKKYKLGIIPHYVDSDNEWIKNIDDPDVKIIDICGDTCGFVDELKECENIASSSLHGIIMADAYNIPSVWIRMSNLIGGGDFKYMDYFSSVNRRDTTPLLIDKNTDIKMVLSSIPEYDIDIDLDKLYNSCPFKQ